MVSVLFNFIQLFGRRGLHWNLVLTNLPVSPKNIRWCEKNLSITSVCAVCFTRNCTHQCWAFLNCIPTSLCQSLRAESSRAWSFALPVDPANLRISQELSSPCSKLPQSANFAKVRNYAVSSSGQRWAGWKCWATHSVESRPAHDICNPDACTGFAFLQWLHHKWGCSRLWALLEL